MSFQDLRSFLDFLEQRGELARIECEVDPYLEAPEIAARVVRQEGPALLFKNVKGSKFSLLMNLFGSKKRITLALGREPAEIGQEIVSLAARAMDSGLSGVADSWKTLLKVFSARIREVSRGAVTEISEACELTRFPVTWSWPGDGGYFFTFPLVITRDPGTGRHNVGIYRMQIFDSKTTGMHWQIEKGGRFHLEASRGSSQTMPVSVAVGSDPALLLSAVLPLPEGFDEMAFAGFLRGAPTRVLKDEVRSPADAEVIFQGQVNPLERRDEGPFGDHYGHYSARAPFPVFHIKHVLRRKDPIFHATVVGKPPMEDWHLGVMTMEMMKPLVRLLHGEIKDLWAYPEAGFHNLQVVAVDERYGREGLKSAMFLLGMGQTSLAKVVVIVNSSVNVQSFDAVLASIGRCFKPEEDFFLLAPTSTDTLDFAGMSIEKGSKAIFFATTAKEGDELAAPGPSDLKARFRQISECVILGGTLLAFKTGEDPGASIRELISSPLLGSVKLVAAVSDDVDLGDTKSIIWGIFTRFDPARDITSERVEARGVRAVVSGRMGLDCTLKQGYPEPLEMPPGVRNQVDRRWKEYFGR